MARQSIPLDGYPAPGGSATRYDWRGDHFGNNNYQTGGYVVTAASLAINGFETVSTSAQSYSNNYMAKVFYPSNSGNTESRAPVFANITVKWFYSANNTEVAANTDLSAESVRLTASGI